MPQLTAHDRIRIRNLTLCADTQRILGGLNLDLHPRGLTALMGPMGTGKSALLAWLCAALPPGLTALPGASLHPQCPGILVPQPRRGQAPQAPADQIAQQRAQALDAACALAVSGPGGSALICVDEITADLSPEQARPLLDRLCEIAQRRAVLMVSHRADDVRASADHVVLMGGGGIVAHLPTAQFFAAGPQTLAGHFLRTGGLSLPRPDTAPHLLAPELRVPPAGFNLLPAPRALDAPVWIMPGRLFLLPQQPGAALPEHSALLQVLDDAVQISAHGQTTRHPWPEGSRAPESNLARLHELVREMECTLHDHPPLAIAATGNRDAVLALLGAFHVKRGFGPEAAIRHSAEKMPEIRHGLRFEQLVWDYDNALSMGQLDQG